jgi:hypothetical protein
LSKISDRLTKLGQTERSGFGFGTRQTSMKVPVILVCARIDKPGDAQGLDADIFVLMPGANGAAQTTSPGDVDLWGVAVSGGSGEEIDSAVEVGADFIIVEDESAPGSALRDDDRGRGFVVGPEVSDDRARAIDSGPFDFLVLDGSDLNIPLNVGSALDIQEQLSRYSSHIFLSVAEVPGKPDLELLRDIGISALLYDSKSAIKVDLAGLRSLISEIEPKKQKVSADAMLSRSNEPNPRQQADFDDDDDDHDHGDEEGDWE